MSGPRRPSPARRQRGADPARRAAWEVLRAVDERDAYANLVLPGVLRAAGLESRDRAFATELAYGSLRATGTLDHVLALAANRPVERIDAPLRDALRLGAYQLLRTRVPAHAAVAATVDLVADVIGRRGVGFANAVLRRVAERAALTDDAERVGAPPLGSDPVGNLALRHDHPRWIVRAFADALGGDTEELERALAADNARPVTHLVARGLDRDDLLRQAGPGAEPGPWSARAVHLTAGGDPGALSAVRDRRAGVQDEGSQLCAAALASAPLAQGGDTGRWTDLCSGPGGKTALLSALGPPGLRLVAVEPQPSRAALVARAAPAATVVRADGRHAPLPAASQDRVLVDAPCTGLGALRRRPESRWRRRPDDVARLTSLQRQLLAAGLDLLRPGGALAYVTCSPHVAEATGVVDEVLRSRRDVHRIDARPLLPGVPSLGDGPSLQLWPHRHGTDAMALTVLTRLTG